MSYECMAWANKQRTGSVYHKAVLMQLADRTNNDTGLCIPRIRRIAEDAEISVESVKKSLRALSEMGLIEIIPRKWDGIQLSNSYKLMTPEHKDTVYVVSEGGSLVTPHRYQIPTKEPVREPVTETKERMRTESPKDESEDFSLSLAVAKTPPRKGGRPPQVPVPLPDDFKPSPEHIKVAAANGVDVEICLKTMRAWAIGKVRADWNRQFAVFLTPDKFGRNLAKKTEERKFTPIPKYDAEGNVITGL